MKRSIIMVLALLLFPGCEDPASVDPLPGITTGFNNVVMRIVVQPNDGKIIVGGNFRSFNGIPANRIVRLNSDGSIDNDFVTGTGFDDPVHAISLDQSGRVLVGGISLGTYNGTPIKNMVRLNSDGSLDVDFNNNLPVFNNRINCFALQGTKVVIGGSFTFSAGATNGWNGIARVNDDGSADPTFTPGSGFGGDDCRSVKDIIVHPSGKLIIGGCFNSFNNVIKNNIVGLNQDGSLLANSVFDTGDGFTGSVNALILQPDGKLIAAGAFTEYNGVNRQITRLLENGDIDTDFNPTDSFVFSGGHILALALQWNGKVLVGGTFSLPGPDSSDNMVRLNCDGTLDNSFESGHLSFGGTINTVALMDDGRILVGGHFDRYRDQEVGKIVSLAGDSNGSCITVSGANDIFCTNTLVTLTATGGESYLWSIEGGSSTIVSPTSSTTAVILTATTTFSVAIITTDGCFISCSKTLEVGAPCD